MKLNVLMAIGLTVCALTACNNNKAKDEEKQQLDSLLKVHDHVMDKNELLLDNKNKLDTLLKKFAGDTAKAHAITKLNKQIGDADNAMENWMHKFNADYTGKSHDQIMQYLKEQREQITKIDAQLTAAVDTSSKFLAKTK